MELIFRLLEENDIQSINIIADWYQKEWNIPIEVTKNRLTNFETGKIVFQMLMLKDDEMIGTGGIYYQTSLTEIRPDYSPLLALVYTIKPLRGLGLGFILCQKIQEEGLGLGLKRLYLHTNTAKSLYLRLGWELLETINHKEKEISVMQLSL
jgi:GNAT superfamily N-acetyltransferase